MLCYQSFLGIRDSDKLTFENRLREGFKFLEQNIKEYRDIVNGTIDHNKRHWDGTYGHDITIMRDLSPIIVLAHAQVGTVTACFLVLNSRLGCIFSLLHAVALIITVNTIHFRGFIIQFMNAKEG